MDRGFSVVEVLVALVVLMVGIVPLAQLSLVSIRANRTARVATFATLLAEEKLEQLQSLAWSADGEGATLSDVSTDTSIVPELSAGGTGLQSSPAGTLLRDTSGYCDFLDNNGQPLGGGVTPPAGAIFRRRWSIDPLPASADSLVIQVSVSRIADRVGTGSARAPGEARLVTIRSRHGV
jgi:hypothetical protein